MNTSPIFTLPGGGFITLDRIESVRPYHREEFRSSVTALVIPEGYEVVISMADRSVRSLQFDRWSDALLFADKLTRLVSATRTAFQWHEI